MGNGTPVITSGQCTLRRIYNQLIINVLKVPLPRQLHQPIKIPLLYFWVESSFIQGIQVVDYMHEFGPIKHLLVFVNFNVGTHEPTHPVVGDNYGREDLQLAKGL